jgi:hypothetical protein
MKNTDKLKELCEAALALSMEERSLGSVHYVVVRLGPDGEWSEPYTVRKTQLADGEIPVCDCDWDDGDGEWAIAEALEPTTRRFIERVEAWENAR